MAVDKSLVSGSTTMLILKILEEKEMYGYEMIDTLRKKSSDVFELKAGTLYPLLHSLEKEKFLETYDEIIGGKTRKYYKITPKGKKQLISKTEQWKEYSNAVARVMGGACYGNI